MKRRVLASVILGWLCSLSIVAYPDTKIRYDIADLGLGRWEYTYEVSNLNLSVPIEEFTIWFDYVLYANLAITTQEPLASQWDERILQDTGLGEPIGYDGLAQTGGILPAQMANGFSVSFDWLGAGNPGPQSYEIINPIDYTTIDSGFTVPEPSVCILMGLGGLIIARRNKIKR